MWAAARLVALVPKSWPAAQGAVLHPVDLRDATLITFDLGSVHGRMMSRFLAEGAVLPRQTHRVRFAQTAIGFAEEGIGIALVDEFTAMSADMTRVIARPTSSSEVFSVYLSRNLSRAQSKLMQSLEHALRNALS